MSGEARSSQFNEDSDSHKIRGFDRVECVKRCVRLFNTYRPDEHYSPYRSAICLFSYRLLHDILITVYRGYKRTRTYITDMARSLSNISDNFKPGDVYNIGGEDFHSIEEAADIILRLTGKEKRRKALVFYKAEEMLTTRQKKVDCAKARRDLKHEMTVTTETGIANTLAWMREVYKAK
jgi:dTDP-glucose 4,6-dehydratase